jgi:hypothetical protein
LHPLNYMGIDVYSKGYASMCPRASEVNFSLVSLNNMRLAKLCLK